jgi:hypothetical protein
MAEALRGCLSLTLSGFAYASHDIGGFEVSVFSEQNSLSKILAKIHGIFSTGTPSAGDLSTMGGVWTFFISLAASRLLIIPSSMAIWRRCCKMHGEICGGETSPDALSVQFGAVTV